jgi:uncharacterized protein
VKDAHEVVKAGDVVKVRVVDIDIARKRIGLSMRKDGETGASRAAPRDSGKPQQRVQPPPKPQRDKPAPAPQGALAQALAEALKRR